MFSWLKKRSDPMDAGLREATLKRLAQVLELPEEDFAGSQDSRKIPSETPREVHTEPALSRGY